MADVCTLEETPTTVRLPGTHGTDAQPSRNLRCTSTVRGSGTRRCSPRGDRSESRRDVHSVELDRVKRCTTIESRSEPGYTSRDPEKPKSLSTFF